MEYVGIAILIFSLITMIVFRVTDARQKSKTRIPDATKETYSKQEFLTLKKAFDHQVWVAKVWQDRCAYKEKEYQEKISFLEKQLEETGKELENLYYKRMLERDFAAVNFEKYSSDINSKLHDVKTCPTCNGLLPVNFLMQGGTSLDDECHIMFFGTCQHCKKTHNWSATERISQFYKDTCESDIQAIFRIYGNEENFFMSCVDEFLWRFEQFGTVEPYSPPPLTKRT